MTHVSVLGSINLDLVLPVDRFPKLGETVLATGGYQGPGGKGLNQAIAAHRCGATTRFYGRIGSDSAGQTLCQEMQSAGLDSSYLEQDAVLPTGIAHIFVCQDSENAIVVSQGANGALTEGGAAAASQGAAVLLLQLEVPLPVVRAALAAATPGRTIKVLNAAPAILGAQALFELCDIVIVNETEAEFFGGVAEILGQVTAGVILTLGSAGAVWTPVQGAEIFCPAYDVTAVDTTGAGDAFCGALAAELSRGAHMSQALTVASAAGAITATSHGAQAQNLGMEEIHELHRVHELSRTQELYAQKDDAHA